MIDHAIILLAPLIGTRDACVAVGRSRATHYRHHRSTPGPPSSPRPRPKPTPQPRALTVPEQAAVLDVLHWARFTDMAPAEIHAILLDEGVYLCSVATMYRLLRAAGETGERRSQATHPARQKPELMATEPNRVWSWDITKLKGPAKWSYFHLYCIIDIFSRYTVGWLLATQESTVLAERLLADTIRKQRIDRNQLTIHSDNGSSMASKPVAFLLADLGVTKSHSRPHVSNDNPFSEAQFKTLKYRSEFPDRFQSLEHAKAFCTDFFAWYNNEHRHSGVGMHTPANVHHALAGAVHEARAGVLTAAFVAHPERFVRHAPRPLAFPSTSWINEPVSEAPNSTNV